MRIWVSLLFVLISVSMAHAEYFVCGNGVRPQCANTTGLTRIHPSVDPSQVTDETCVAVPEGQLEAQKTLIQTVIASHANGRCHLEVVGGLAAEMDAGEKAAVNTAMQAVEDAQQTFQQELAQNDTCATLTLADLNTLLAARKATRQSQLDTAHTNTQAQIDAIVGNSAAIIRASLTALRTLMKNGDQELLDETYLLMQRLARCALARTRAGQ